MFMILEFKVNSNLLKLGLMKAIIICLNNLILTKTIWFIIILNILIRFKIYF